MVTRQDHSGRRETHGIRPRRSRLADIFLLLVFYCMLPQVMAAATVDITAVVGFTDTFYPGRWAPLSVTVTNHGRDLVGELEVQVTGGNELRGRQFVTTHRRTLELQRGARKTLQFTVLPQSLFHPLVIRVHAGGQELARSEVDLRTRFVAYERLLLVLSRDANLDYLNDRTDNGVRVLYPHPELLPTHWRGYDAVAAVVVHGVSLERLSANQFDALRKWIAQGGVLAVSGGPEYTLLRTPRLAALLPGLPVGTTRVDPAALQSVFSSLQLSRPIHINRLDAILGSARVRAGDVTLIAERTLGFGRVIYLTFDVAGYPFDRWQGMRDLWLDSLRLPPLATTSPGSVDPLLGEPLAALIRSESADFPSYITVLLFVALYVGLLVAGYQLSVNAARPRSVASLWIWAAPALFGLAAWLLFGPTAFPRGASVISVAVIEPFPDSSYAKVELDLGVYANRSGAARLEYRGAEPVLYPRPAQRGGTVGDWVFGEGARPYVEPQDRRRYVLHVLQAEDVIGFDLKVSVYDETSGPRLVLDNASGRTLENLRLVFDGYAYDLGSVAAGVQVERRLDRRTQGSALGKEFWRDVLKPPQGIEPQMLEPTRIALERRSKASGESGSLGPGRALLVGYTASPLRPAGGSADWQRRERAVVTMRVTASTSDAAAANAVGEPREQSTEARARAEPSPRSRAAAVASPAPRDE